MLQQTQAERVRPHFERFLTRFPTPAALADAGAGPAIEAWAGLGYNRRAVNLHRAAVEIVARFEGRVPSSVEDLRTLPGVGLYTASAVACFAFGAPRPVVDTNVRRVLTRHRLGLEPREVTDSVIDDLASSSLPAAAASDWSQALMDLARAVCRSRPRCEECPLAPTCAYRLSGRAPMRAPNGRPQARFEGSARQARGRVVGLLREQGQATIREVAATTGWPQADAATLVQGLERDGLCVASAAARSGRAGGHIRLP